jgi:phosphomannomutase/phosphoglucomutase
MNKNIFREYDIRGVAERDLDSSLVRDLGRALVSELATADSSTFVVGRDCRLTSPRLREALIEGITSCGGNVLDIGVVPTPVLYFAAFDLRPTGAVIITGSHNPAQDNGFKMLRGTDSIHGPAIQRLRERIESKDFCQADRSGTVEQVEILDAYLNNARSSLELGERRCKVVLDAGNGTGGPIAAELYRSLGFDVVELFCEMDGNFPNHHPDPTVESNLEALKEKVASTGAELGIALDGDADRVGAVDGQGRVLWGDQLLILLGREVLKEAPGSTIIGEVKCSQALYDELEKAGGNPIMWKVGHSLIKAKMKESGALLSGEMSGHIFFAHRYLGFDDGVYSGARLLELLSNSPKTLSDHYETLPRMVNTPELRVECPDAIKFDVVSAVAKQLEARSDVASVITVDGVRANFSDGWGLVRASNTQPSLVLRCEAQNEPRLKQLRGILEESIANVRNSL